MAKRAKTSVDTSINTLDVKRSRGISSETVFEFSEPKLYPISPALGQSQG